MEELQPVQYNVEANRVREEYLHRVGQDLATRLSPLETYESVEEMRSHINAMASAYEEVGIEPVAAMHAALQKFGNSETVAAVSHGVLSVEMKFVAAVINAMLGIMMIVSMEFLRGEMPSFMLSASGPKAFLAAIGLSAGVYAFIGANPRLSVIKNGVIAAASAFSLLQVIYVITLHPGVRWVTFLAPCAMMTIFAFVLGLTGSYIARSMSRGTPSRPQRPTTR